MSLHDADRFTVVLDKNVSATPERAFEAFTDPELLSKWFTTSAEADLRVGGRYRNADNDEGEYLAIDPPKRVLFTWENANHCPGTVVEVEFQRTSSQSTAVALRHRGIENQEGSDEMREGWSWALDSLKSFLETGAPIPHSEWVAAQSDGSDAPRGG